MTPQSLALVTRGGSMVTRRDLVRPVFRHWRSGLATFLVLAALAMVVAIAAPYKYEAGMKILVKPSRVEAENGPVTPAVTENDINSEVALLNGRDLHEQLALAAGLVAGAPGQKFDAAALAAAVRTIDKALDVSPARRSAIIEVRYSDRDPARAVRVLSVLAKLYLQKHVQVFGSPGAYPFFTQQAERLRADLKAAQDRLLAFGEKEKVVSAGSEKARVVEQLAEFRAGREQLRAQIADSTSRLLALNREIATTPERQVTQRRSEENPALMSELTAKVLDLELKRTEMLRKFSPSYPPAVEVDQQLAQARQALAAAQRSPMRNESTDQNPTHQWLRNEMVRVQAEREALRARAEATALTIAAYERRAGELDAQDARQQDLLRAVKSAEDNLLLYQRKAEEARIADALDRDRIANVSIAEAPGVPLEPLAARRALMLALALVGALILGTAATYAFEYLSPRFRTRSEVESVLELPVLAALPASSNR